MKTSNEQNEQNEQNKDKYKMSIFIFRRDFRLDDNIGLINALSKSDKVIPIFILTPEQLVNNIYKSDNCVQFMIESLMELDKDLKSKGSRLFFFFGKPHQIINNLIPKVKAESIFVNRDYTLYSKERDNNIEKVCKKFKIDFNSYEDVLLQPVGSIRTGGGDIYSKFTPFFNTAKKVAVNNPKKNNYNNYYPKSNKIVGEFRGDIHKFYTYNDNIAVNGGRKNALKILSNIDKFKNYNKERDILSVSTTKLSAYIKFGCVSIREVYHKIKSKLGMKNDLIKQLYWREFYYNIAEYNPNIFSNDWKEKNFKENYKKLKWITYKNATDEQKKMFKAFTDCKTGFPLVDASNKQMQTTGFMANRGRLIVASFLIKDMYFHWAEGEKYFSKWLVDLDGPNNNGNWQFVSGSGVDTQPYFRVFSPWSQMRFDPECVYIKKWIPELKDVPNKHIHEWYKYHNLYPNIGYPKPIFDHKVKAKNTIEKYKKALYS